MTGGLDGFLLEVMVFSGGGGGQSYGCRIYSL